MGIEAWAEKRGEQPKAALTARSWLADHPDVLAECREARTRGWSWQQITDYITETYAYPLKDCKAVARECL